MNTDRLASLWDERQVVKVMLRFGRALDTGDWPAYRSCFTDVLNVDFKRLTGFDETRVNADEWTLFAEQILSPVRRHHVYTNFDIHLQGDRAFALVYMTANHWKSTDLGTSYYIQYGWYNVSFERAGDSWKMYRLKHDFQWVEGNNSLLSSTDPELGKTMARVFCPANIKAAAQAALAPGFQRAQSA